MEDWFFALLFTPVLLDKKLCTNLDRTRNKLTIGQVIGNWLLSNIPKSCKFPFVEKPPYWKIQDDGSWLFKVVLSSQPIDQSSSLMHQTQLKRLAYYLPCGTINYLPCGTINYCIIYHVVPSIIYHVVLSIIYHVVPSIIEFNNVILKNIVLI